MGSDTMPTATQTVTVHYHGYLLDGTVFDSSIDRGAPATFSLTSVIPGWTEGIPYFGIGGTGKLLVPSQLAYSSQGTNTGSIPPYTPIAFDIELLDIVF
jgi:FKBP-type peptidyl-prolyl cis-trans isomerase